MIEFDIMDLGEHGMLTYLLVRGLGSAHYSGIRRFESSCKHRGVRYLICQLTAIHQKH